MTQSKLYKKVVVLEPDQVRRDYFRAVISELGHIPFCFEKETICLDNLLSLSPDLVIAGSIYLDRISRFVNSLKMISYNLPLLICSDNKTIHEAINSNGFPAVLMIKENARPSDLKRTINMASNNGRKSEMVSAYPIIVGNSEEIIKIKNIIPELSRSQEAIFIRGEIGSGRELVAKSICLRSDRREKPFVKINAAQISRELMESELFGKKQGSTSGDRSGGKGLFEMANSGTIFLDEIDALPADLQVRLLHMMERDGSAGRASGADPPIDIRVIAAAGVGLESLVEKGRFRKDLYYRLNVLNVDIPPLRDRMEDTPLLADYFGDKFCMQIGRCCFEIPKKIKMMLCSYHWPSNVAELEKMIKSMVVYGNPDKIEEILGVWYKNGKSWRFVDLYDDFSEAELSDLKRYLGDLNQASLKEICRVYKIRVEAKLMKKALEVSNWNRKKTARMLNISYRSLLNKINAYGLKKHRIF